MPLDGITIASVVHELNATVLGGRIDKITQPEPDEIIINMRGGGTNHKLLITANSNAPRLGFTNVTKQSPLKAPMFCMVLRKHLTSGRILNISQPNFERIVEFDIESMDEMGDKSVKTLLVEIMGKHSNIILVDKNRKILESIKHVPPSVSSVRPVLPGMMYSSPPSSKKNPLEVHSAADFKQSISVPVMKIQEAIYKNLNGISPIAASEICSLANVLPDTFTADLTEGEFALLFGAFSNVFTRISAGDFDPVIYLDEAGKMLDFSAFPLSVYGMHATQNFASPSNLLETFYVRRDESYRVSQKITDLKKLVTTHQERSRKKQFVYDKTLEEIKDRDILRIKGELLNAYMYAVEKGANTFVAENFYDENKPLEINLDSTLTAAENAQRYFKLYNKQKRTFAALEEQMVKNNEDLAYLDSVAIAMDTITDEADIAEIRAELAEQGFAKRIPSTKNRKAVTVSKPLKYISADGFEMYVGKNNTQNDMLTMKTAKPADIWMHTKDIPGSHVIIVTEGREVPPSTILEGANLAAYHSKAKNSAGVPVDYVQKKYVKKPNGAKPGFVIYEGHSTVYVTPVEPPASL